MDKTLDDFREYIVVGTTLQPVLPSEISVFNDIAAANTKTNTDYKWRVNDTKTLIDHYAKYRKKLGTLEVKNVKMMWQRIAAELCKLNIQVTYNNCLNRWKVLERNYKKFVDDQNKTGRGRKFFEYQTEMEDIFGKKRNVHPEILLSSDTVNNSLDDPENIITMEKSQTENTIEKLNIGTCGSPSKQTVVKTPTTPKRKYQVIRRKVSSLERIRLDRKEYYDARLQIERLKLEEMKKRNELIKERNEIMLKKSQN